MSKNNVVGHGSQFSSLHHFTLHRYADDDFSKYGIINMLLYRKW